MATTNYQSTFIAVAADCPVSVAQPPPSKEPPSAAQIAFAMLDGHPYEYTSDDVLYAANGARRGLSREAFLSQPQPCFRASPLTKRYGWGVHADAAGWIAIYAVESAEYQRLATDTSLRQLSGLKTKKA